VWVLDLEDFNFSDRWPIETPILLARDRIIGRDEEQTVGMIEIDAELVLAVTGHFMTSGRWETGNLTEVFCRTQLQKALLQLAGTGGSKGFLDLLGGRTDLLKLLGPKEYLHGQMRQNNSHTMFTFFTFSPVRKSGTLCGSRPPQRSVPSAAKRPSKGGIRAGSAWWQA
jgi:hypothetical protein